MSIMQVVESAGLFPAESLYGLVGDGRVIPNVKVSVYMSDCLSCLSELFVYLRRLLLHVLILYTRSQLR